MKLSSLLASAAFVAMSQMLFSSCGSSAPDPAENIDLIPVTTSKDGKWSMVNDKGEIVYDSEFKNRPTAAYNGLFSVEEGKGYTVYKIGSKAPEAVDGLENLKDVGYLEDGLMPVTFPGKRICVVDASGKTKFELNPLKGTEIVRCAAGFVDGMLLIKTEDDKYGYVNKSGEAVILPVYDDANIFADGLAVVAKAKEEGSSERIYLVIDKKGNEVFKIKEGYELETSVFSYGYIVASKEDRYYLFNQKGEETKLSSKIARIRDYNDKFIIYRSEDGDYGVMNFDEEIVIRPKYSQIMFGNGNFFLAKKDSDDKEFVKIDSNGDESNEKIDYEELMSFGHFGYFAQEGKTIVMLNDKFAKKGKEEFFDINTGWHRGGVYTDYFNAADVATTMVKMIDGNKVGSLVLGASASEVMKGRSPQDYTYRSEVNFNDLDKKGFRYEISVKALFSDNIADYDYNYYSYNYSRNYYWNSSSKLLGISLSLDAESDWGKQGQEAFNKALEAAGYKLLKEGKYDDSYVSAFKKNNVLILAQSKFEGRDGVLLVVDASNNQIESALLSGIMSLDGSEVSSTEEVAYEVEADSCVAVEAVSYAADSCW